MLECYYKLQPTVPEFKDATQLIWSALPEEASDNAVKDYCKQLKACVSQRWTFEQIMWQFI